MRSKIVALAGAMALALLLVTHPVVVDAAGPVTSADIKDGTIQERDLAPGARSARAGQESYRFKLQPQTPAQEIAYSLTGLPPGKYVFVYSLQALEDGTAATLQCALRQSAQSRRQLGFSYATSAGSYMSATGAGAIRVTSAPPRFSCLSVSDTFEIYDDPDQVRPSTITLTRVGSLSTSVAQVAPASR